METTTGKGKYGTRKSVMVRVVDREKLSKAARKIIAVQYGLTAKQCAEYEVEPLVVVRNSKRAQFSDRDVCVVGTEGVGWECDEYGLALVPVSWKQSFGTTNYVRLSGSVIANCLSDEEVDLADWVRVFGDRLEGNFDLWYQTATVGSKPRCEQ